MSTGISRCLWKVSAAVLLATWLPSALWAQVDAVFANEGWPDPQPNRACLGDGSGGFACSDVSANTNSTRGVALGLVDGDDHLDAVFANYDGPNRVCLGDGSGGFACSDVSANTNSSQGVALGFVDGDDHLDAVFGGYPSNVCLGDGNGGFSCSEISGGHSSRPALGFVDGNGMLDVVFSGSGVLPFGGSTFSIVCLGDGNGGFSCSLAQGGGDDVALAKIDGDDHLDAVFAGRYDDTLECMGSVLCLGDGNGDFSSCLGIDGSCSVGVALGFVDGDHNLDAVFAHWDWPDPQPNRVCLGDGSGGFACSDVSTDDRSTTGVALGDVDSYEIFTDGFESGDTSAWGATMP